MLYSIQMKQESSFNMLWNVAPRGKRGPKPECSLESVVQAGIEVADAEGLAALTMNRVAEKLGVTTMAIYRYVPGKMQLVDLMMDKALGSPPAKSSNWRKALAQWAKAEHARLFAHPWLLESVMSRTSLGPNWVAWLNAALEGLSSCPLTARQKVAVVFAIDGHVRASVQVETGVGASTEFAASFANVLKLAQENERYSALAEVAAAGGFDKPGRKEKSSFEFGLERLLDGIETLM